MTTLTKADKANLINSRIKGLEYNKYSVDLDLIVENAKSDPDEATVSALESRLLEINNQIAALNTELATVNAIVE
jgi:hypothetical protein